MGPWANWANEPIDPEPWSWPIVPGPHGDGDKQDGQCRRLPVGSVTIALALHRVHTNKTRNGPRSERVWAFATAPTMLQSEVQMLKPIFSRTLEFLKGPLGGSSEPSEGAPDA